MHVLAEGAGPALGHAAWLLRRLGATVTQNDGADHATLATSGHRVDDRTQQSVVADWAQSGAMWLTGVAAGPPLLPPGSAATAARGALLAFELLSAFAGNRVSLPGHRLLGEHAAALGLCRQGPRSAGGAFRLFPTADGLIGLSLARPSDVELVPALIQGVVTAEPWDAVLEWAVTQRAETAVSRAQELGRPAAVVPAPGATPDPQALARGRLGPFVLHAAGPAPTGPAPRGNRPLVVDLSSLWAGPLCAHLLGLTGARVVKVESRSRPDGARSGPPVFYDLLHCGHESVACDFADPADIARLRGLLDTADVVLESSRPRAMAQLGIEPAARTARGAHRTWVSITAYGRTGPWANRVGFGDDAAAAAGLVAIDPETATPVPVGDAIADPLAGVHAAVAALASMIGGGSRIIDVSLRDVAAMTLVQPPSTGAAGARAYRVAGGWEVAGPEGPVLVEPPQLRSATGAAAPSGAHTDAVLAELGLR
jgi:crotonobetainyl-CoA:carnitine CoA-transferase CaiB-like acyl-CoA transferase